MDEVFNFHWSPSQDHIKISQFTKFEVLLLDCNHVEGFQISGKLVTCLDLRDAISELETLVWNLGDI